MEVISSPVRGLQKWYEDLWELRDKRVDGWFMMDSFWPTLVLVAGYVYIVKIWGPRFMKDRKPYNIDTFLIYYNASQVILSAYIFIQVRIRKAPKNRFQRAALSNSNALCLIL